jgi:hypothetical protein
MMARISSFDSILTAMTNNPSDLHFFLYYLHRAFFTAHKLHTNEMHYIFTNRTTGHLQHKQDLIYLTDYLCVQNKQSELKKKQANGIT